MFGFSWFMVSFLSYIKREAPWDYMLVDVNCFLLQKYVLQKGVSPAPNNGTLLDVN